MKAAVWEGSTPTLTVEEIPRPTPRRGEILLKVEDWPTVERVLQHVDAIEAAGIDPSAVAPDHWRHVHHRLSAGQTPSAYTATRHEAWLRRRSVMP